jgi:hypothetical protein
MMTRVVHPSGFTYVRISDLPRCGEFVSCFPAVPLTCSGFVSSGGMEYVENTHREI